MRILVVDDNETNLRILERQLASWGMQSTCVSSGAKALISMRREAKAGKSYELAIIDMQMPEMDGYEATAEIRRREQGLSTRTIIIAMTAHAVDGEREKCLGAGMDDYLSKPVKAHELAEILDRWSPGRRQQREPVPTGTPDSDFMEQTFDASLLGSLRELQQDGSPDLITA